MERRESTAADWNAHGERDRERGGPDAAPRWRAVLKSNLEIAVLAATGLVAMITVLGAVVGSARWLKAGLEAEIGRLDANIAQVKHDLEADIAQLRHDLEADIAQLRDDLEADIAQLRDDLEDQIARSIRRHGVANRHHLGWPATADRRPSGADEQHAAADQRAPGAGGSDRASPAGQGPGPRLRPRGSTRLHGSAQRRTGVAPTGDPAGPGGRTGTPQSSLGSEFSCAPGPPAVLCELAPGRSDARDGGGITLAAVSFSCRRGRRSTLTLRPWRPP